MVIPRSRSSGALSIVSNARNATFGFVLASTLVIAAVSVVLPWSMCPIVPTFTCGLLRTNFCFAMSFGAPLQTFSASIEWGADVAQPRGSHGGGLRAPDGPATTETLVNTRNVPLPRGPAQAGTRRNRG